MACISPATRPTTMPIFAPIDSPGLGEDQRIGYVRSLFELTWQALS